MDGAGTGSGADASGCGGVAIGNAASGVGGVGGVSAVWDAGWIYCDRMII